jgi:hypothetical protein
MSGVGELQKATRSQMQAGLNWAAEYGRSNVVAHPAGEGSGPAPRNGSGRPRCIGAAIGGQAEAARILLDFHAPFEVKNSYGGTVLGQAVWSALHDRLGINDEILRRHSAAGPQA